jgi:transposase
LRYFGGVPKAIVPDNLKSGVKTACNYEPQINRTYLDFARHYSTAILPARAAKPKDKALVEGAIKLIYQRVYAQLRNTNFFEIQELNNAISVLTHRHNNLNFQQRKTSRYKLFMEIEKPVLKTLPVKKYDPGYFKELKVQFNYHVYLNEDGYV